MTTSGARGLPPAEGDGSDARPSGCSTPLSPLVIAALNVLAFRLTVYRRVDRWNEAPAAPAIGKAVAVVSLAVWVAAIFAGRMIGFTTTRTSISEPAPADVNFEELLGLPAGDQTPAPPPTK